MSIYGICGADHLRNTTRLSYVCVPKLLVLASVDDRASRVSSVCATCYTSCVASPLPCARLFAPHSSRTWEPELESEAGRNWTSAAFLATVVPWLHEGIYNSPDYQEPGLRSINQYKNKGDWCARLFETPRTLSADKVKQKATYILDGHCAGCVGLVGTGVEYQIR